MAPRKDSVPKGSKTRGKSGSGKRLETYRAKRSAERTLEPFGTKGTQRPQLFVVQKHSATRLHHDFRLEWGGTLWSWALPHGPSLDPMEKRLAVHVEDHPVEYADFEGIIPKGNYGAGPVIVWDRGVWLPFDDPDEGLESGKLHFELRGFKLHGIWTLIRLKGSGKDWLLIKKKDAWAAPEGTQPFDEQSILSGLTLEELRDGTSRAGDIRKQIEKQKAPRKKLDPGKIKLMLAETADAPFSRAGWVFELKYDGYRMLAARKEDGSSELRYRSGMEVGTIFPELALAVRALPYAGLILDGEVVVLDPESRPDFQRLQQRARLRRPSDIERATVELPATLFVFDLLGFEDFDLRALPLTKRKALLRLVLPANGPLRFADHMEERGAELFEEVRKRGLEGLLAKKADAPYRAGRSAKWLKIAADRSGDFVICGFTAPQGSRPGFGALHVGAYDKGQLVYAGRVGTGFTDPDLTSMREELDGMLQEGPPCTGAVPTDKGHQWVEPRWIAEVRYKTWTRDGHLRHPVFVRLRDDKSIEECTPPPRSAPEPPPPPPEPETERKIRFTRPEKIFWPKEHYTKKDLVNFYREISPWLLPYLKDRPLVVTRYPDGIDGKSFYQKNAPDFVPSWIRTEGIWSESSEREIEYFVCDDVDMLLYIANMGTIVLHVWPSRTTNIQRPDWCILDLDPKGAPFLHVVELARAIGKLCEKIGIESFVKTSGSTGLHVLLPLGGQCTYEQSRMLAHLIARILNEEHPDISTIARVISARGGRVYLDYLQNRHGQLLVAPFSVRPLPGAPVSTPLRWSEVNARLDPKKFTIRTVIQRLQKTKNDPVAKVLTAKPDLQAALARLAEILDAKSHKQSTKRRKRKST